METQDSVQRAAYDAGLAAVEHAPAFEVDLDDMQALPSGESARGGGGTFSHGCRCGATICFTEADLREDASCVEFACATCSLRLRVHYALGSCPHGQESDNPIKLTS